MGKVKKIHHKRVDPLQKRPGDLVSELSSHGAKLTTRVKKRGFQQEDSEFVGSQLSSKILQQARKQQEDLEEESGVSGSRGKKKKPQPQVTLKDIAADNSDADSAEEATLDGAGDEYDYEVVEVDANEERTLEAFMSRDVDSRSQLADILKDRITDCQTEIQSQMSETTAGAHDPLPEAVRELYSKLAPVLSKYRSGKVAKAFKMIPHLRQWEQAVLLTQPDSWSAAAMYQATRVFVSNMKPHMLQRFLSKYVLPRVRDDISEYKKLNFHLYQSVKKSMFKPAAFFKGIILPLCRSGTCTLREALILSSVLSHESVNMEHASVAMCKIAELPYSGATSIMLRVLLEKRYNLPRRAVQTVSASFLKFADERRALPVLWHQSLLSLAQRYKTDIAPDVREAILTKVLPVHRHPMLTPLIRDELISAAETDAMQE